MEINFTKNKYCIIKKAVSKDIADLCYNYLTLKRKVAKSLFDINYIAPFEKMFGSFNDEQVPDTYSIYGDALMETLLEKIMNTVEKNTKLKLTPNYSYARIYKNGDILHKHKDRFSCEISTTLFLGGDEWPIFVNPNPKEGFEKTENNKKSYVPSKNRGIEINLNPGDMLIYRGVELEHHREAFKGQNCAQVFLYYNNVKTKGSDLNIYDQRPHLGLPADIKIKR